jgi:hypothetical protein
LSGARSSPLPVESREPNGYAGKEAIEAPSGVVANAAKINLARAAHPGRQLTVPLRRGQVDALMKTEYAGFA